MWSKYSISNYTIHCFNKVSANDFLTYYNLPVWSQPYLIFTVITVSDTQSVRTVTVQHTFFFRQKCLLCNIRIASVFTVISDQKSRIVKVCATDSSEFPYKCDLDICRKNIIFEAFKYDPAKDKDAPYFYSNEWELSKFGGYEFHSRKNITADEWQQMNNFEKYDIALQPFSNELRINTQYSVTEKEVGRQTSFSLFLATYRLSPIALQVLYSKKNTVANPMRCLSPPERLVTFTIQQIGQLHQLRCNYIIEMRYRLPIWKINTVYVPFCLTPLLKMI